MLYYNLTLFMPPMQLLSNISHQSEFFTYFLMILPSSFLIPQMLSLLLSRSISYALVFIPSDSIIPHYPARQFPAAATNHAVYERASDGALNNFRQRTMERAASILMSRIIIAQRADKFGFALLPHRHHTHIRTSFSHTHSTLRIFNS
jgi:hypothetical protein